MLIVSLDNAINKNVQWAGPYEVALSGFDLAAGGTIVLKLGSDPVAAEVSITYTAGATLADVASAINATLKGGTPNYSSANYGGWAATAADNFVVMGANTYDAARAAIAVVSGCTIRRTPEDINYQTTLAGVLIEGATEYVRHKNGINSPFAGCNPENLLRYYSANGTVPKSNIPLGSATIVNQASFETSEFCAELRAAYADYASYLFGEHMAEYPSAYGAMLRDGRTNTAKIGRLRFTDIYGQSKPCYPAAAAALEYGVAVEGATTGLEAGGWWLPSVEEVYLLMHDRVLTADDVERDPVNRTLARLGKTKCYGSGYYPWTSCECDSVHEYSYSASIGLINNTYKHKKGASRPVSAL